MNSATDTLVTKTMLGVFGCVPAFDTYFGRGSGCWTLGPTALRRIGDFYQSNREAIESVEVMTYDVDTGLPTDRRYPRAKIIDMVFFQAGFAAGGGAS